MKRIVLYGAVIGAGIVWLWNRVPPPWTFNGITSGQWTAFGTMLIAVGTFVIAVVAIGVGVWEWQKARGDAQREDEREFDRLLREFKRDLDMLELDCEPGAFPFPLPPDGIESMPSQKWTLTLTNKSKRRFEGSIMLWGLTRSDIGTIPVDIAPDSVSTHTSPHAWPGITEALIDVVNPDDPPSINRVGWNRPPPAPEPRIQ